jgi:hypothetical protein
MGYVMFIVAFAIGYPLFMIAAYFLAKVFFVKIEDQETDEKVKEALVIKENRLRMRLKKQGLIHA